MREKLQLAINSAGEIASIYEVESGRECNCHCPVCGKPLTAKNRGKSPDQLLEEGQKIAHFAHDNDSVECRYAREAAIHKAAKKILKERKCILIPPLMIEHDGQLINLTRKKKIIFESAEEEKTVSVGSTTIRPDIMLYYEKKQLLVEFRNSHPVDFRKRKLIEQLGITCLEIDIRNVEQLNGKYVNIEGLIKLLECRTENKKWIFSSTKEELALKNPRIKKAKQDEVLRRSREAEAAKIQERDRQIWKDKSEKIKQIKEQGYEFIKTWEYKPTGKPYEDWVTCPQQDKFKPEILFRKDGYDYVSVREVCTSCIYYHSPVVEDRQNVICGYKNGVGGVGIKGKEKN